MTAAARTQAFRGALGSITSRLAGATQQALAVASAVAEASVLTSSRFRDQSGTLRSSTRVAVLGGMRRVLRASTPYAGYVEFGNAPGGVPGARIYPRRAKFLRIPVGGGFIFRRSVASHGPLPFMGDARAEIASALPDALVNFLGPLWSGGR